MASNSDGDSAASYPRQVTSDCVASSEAWPTDRPREVHGGQPTPIGGVLDSLQVLAKTECRLVELETGNKYSKTWGTSSMHWDTFSYIEVCKW